MTDVRLIQVARIYGLVRDEMTDALAKAAVHENPHRLATAIFEEATASDDVISEETALEYLEGRFSFLGDLVVAEDRTAIKRDFQARLEEWLEPLD